MLTWNVSISLLYRHIRYAPTTIKAVIAMDKAINDKKNISFWTAAAAEGAGICANKLAMGVQEENDK